MTGFGGRKESTTMSITGWVEIGFVGVTIFLFLFKKWGWGIVYQGANVLLSIPKVVVMSDELVTLRSVEAVVTKYLDPALCLVALLLIWIGLLGLQRKRRAR